jgi:Putative adhesin
MQEQEGTYQTPEYVSPDEREINTDFREQRQAQTPQEYAERPYTEGYAGFDAGDTWFREDEKVRPQATRKRGIEGLFLLIGLLCVLLIVGNISGIIFSWLSWTIVGVLIVVGAFVIASNWRVVTMPVPIQSFQVMEHPQLVLNNGSGTVFIRRGEQNFVTVAATKRASGIGINLEKMAIEYNQRGDMISIATNTAWNFFQFGLRNIDFEITVPGNSSVQVSNGSGRVAMQGVHGDIKLRTGSGRIEASDLQGRIAMKTGSGRVSMINIAGQVTLATGSGKIELEQAQLVEGAEFKTGSGRITFAGTLDPRGSYRFQTGSGKVSLTLPPDTALKLQAKTGSGKVVNEFAGPKVGNKPRAQLIIKTGSGGIHVQREPQWQ